MTYWVKSLNYSLIGGSLKKKMVQTTIKFTTFSTKKIGMSLIHKQKHTRCLKYKYHHMKRRERNLKRDTTEPEPPVVTISLLQRQISLSYYWSCHSHSTAYLDLQFILYNLIFFLNWEIKHFIFVFFSSPSKHGSFKTTTHKN